MSVSEVNNQSTGIMIPAIATAAGATAGATVMAPAKYKNIAQLVDEASKDDKFVSTVIKASENADDETKKSFKTVSDAVTEVVNNVNDEVKTLFGDKTEVAWNKVVQSTEPLEVVKKQETSLHAIVSAMTKENLINGVDVTDAMKEGFKDADGNFDLAKFTEFLKNRGFEVTKDGEAMKIKNVYLLVEGKNVQTAVEAAAKDGATPEVKAAAKEATNKLSKEISMVKATSAKVVQLLETVDSNGNITKANYEKFQKTIVVDLMSEEINTAFNSIKKSLGKNRIMGGILWGAGALAAGLGIKALVDNKKNA